MIRTIIFEKEEGISSTISDILIPSLGVTLPIWIYNEAGEAGFFSPKQKVAFEQFFYHNSYREQLKEQLRDFYEELVNERELERKNRHHFELDFEFVAIPSQCKTSKNVVYVGAFTNWDREDSEFPLEVEICFEDGEVVWIDELHGNYTFPH